MKIRKVIRTSIIIKMFLIFQLFYLRTQNGTMKKRGVQKMGFLDCNDFYYYSDIINEINENTTNICFEWMYECKKMVIGITDDSLIMFIKTFSDYLITVTPLSSIVLVDTYESKLFGKDLVYISQSDCSVSFIKTYPCIYLKNDYSLLMRKIKKAVSATEFKFHPTKSYKYKSTTHIIKNMADNAMIYAANLKRIDREYIKTGKIKEYIKEAEERHPNTIEKTEDTIQKYKTSDALNNTNKTEKKNTFMNVDLDELIKKHTIDRKFLLNGCAKELVEITSIDIDDAKGILSDIIDSYKTVNVNQEYKSQVTAPTKVDNTIVSRPENEKRKRGGLSCPRCHSQNVIMIDGNPGGTRISANLNPLHPLTPLKTKKKQKKVHSKGKLVAGILTGGTSLLVTGTKKKVDAEFMCQDCGKKFYK